MIRVFKFWDYIRGFHRSLYIQGSYNYKGMLHIGMLYTLYPMLRKISSDPEILADIFKRHSGFFNTNPFLSTYVMGMVLRLEQERLESDSISVEQIDRLKGHISRSLAAVGDRYFWSSLRPLCAVISIITILLFERLYPVNVYMGLAAYLLIFNIPRTVFQYHGLVEGYRRGADIVKYIPIHLIEKYIQWFLLGGVFLLGMFINLEAKKAVQFGWESLVLFLIGAVSTIWLSSRHILKSWKWYLPLGITILFAFILSIL